MASPSDAVDSTEPREATETERPTPSENKDEDVHIPGAPAMVTWVDKDSQQTNNLSHSAHDHVLLHVQHDSSSNTAFFQLRANVSLKARRDRTHIFLSIRPEHVQSVAIVDGDEHQASVNLGTSTYGLEFKMGRPPALVVPKGDVTPKQKSSRLIMDLLRLLARQTCFTVRLAATTLGRDRLISLCDATSSGQLQSIPRFLDVASLYGGKGGRVVEHGSLEAVTADAATSASAQVESPPSYDESNLDSKFAHPSIPQKPNNKRRRASSGSDHIVASSSHKCMSLDVQALCGKMLERIDYGFSELHSRMERMEQRLTDLETCVKGQVDTLQGSIDRVNQSSSEQIAELRDELETGLYDARKETDDIINTRVDDEMYSAQQELHDHVQDEMANVEERVGRRLQERLSNASLSLDIEWND